MMKAALLALLLGWLTQKKELPAETVEDEYDFIIVGAGASGSVVANRLSEDPSLRILVLEAGGAAESFNIGFPMYWPTLQQTPVDWNYKIEPQKHTNKAVPDRTEQWPRGKVIGGSTAINGMMYIRGSRHDYDSWEDRGAAGWGWRHVEPYFRKLESAASDGMSQNLGRDGPLKITNRFATPMHNCLMKAAAKIGIKRTDYHDDIEGISLVTATAFGGTRQDAAGAYLHPIMQARKERLQVVLNAYVTRIVLNQTDSRPRATGVTYIKDGHENTVRARREVIVSAGVIETPHLLMLSGIGHRLHLKKNGIKAAIHLPGVGSNLQDHPMLTMFYHASKMPPKFVINPLWLNESVLEYIFKADGPWMTPVGQDTNVHFRTKSGKISASKMKRPFPDIQILILNSANESAVFQAPREPNDTRSLDFFAGIGLAHPKSRGTVRLKSKDPFQHPAVDPNYLGHEDDVLLYIEGIKHWEELEETSFFKRLGAELILPPYCKKYRKQDVPRSDKFYRCLLKKKISTQYHPCCTARMGSPDDRMAVVDDRLRVYGVDRLRIADASVMPHITSANTQSPCYMIGEKAADMIKQDWKVWVSRY